MADTEEKKKYEPPVVKEIGGIYEQAMGVSACNTGSFFQPSCLGGTTPGNGCGGGGWDSGCIRGNTVV